MSGAPANEIRITNQRSPAVYITYIIRVLEGGPDRDGKEGTKYDEVTIRGMGRAIYTAVNIAEIIKRRVVGLHQITTISSEEMKDRRDSEKKEKTAEPERERKVSVICVKLSRKPLDTTNIGYQAPLPADQVKPQEADRPRTGRGGSRGGRGGSRGGRGGERGRRDDFRPRGGRREEGGYNSRPRRDDYYGGRRDDFEERDGGRPRRDGGRRDDFEERDGGRPRRGGARRDDFYDDYERAPRTRGGRGGAPSGRGRPGVSRGGAAPRGGRGGSAPRGGMRGGRGF